MPLWNQHQLLQEIFYMHNLSEQEKYFFAHVAIAIMDTNVANVSFIHAVGQQVTALTREEINALFAMGLTDVQILEQIAARVLHQQFTQLYTVVHIVNSLGLISESNLIRELLELIPHHTAHIYSLAEIPAGNCGVCGESMTPAPEGLTQEQFDAQMDELRAKRAETQHILEELLRKARQSV